MYEIYTLLKTELTHIFGWNRKNWLLIDIAGTAFGAVIGLIESHIWDPAAMFFIIIGLTACDFVTGVWVGARQRKLETRRFKRGVYTVFAFVLILFFTHNMAKYDTRFSWLPTAVIVPMILIQFASLVKNLSLLGLLPTRFANYLFDRLDVYKNPTDKPDGN